MAGRSIFWFGSSFFYWLTGSFDLVIFSRSLVFRFPRGGLTLRVKIETILRRDQFDSWLKAEAKNFRGFLVFLPLRAWLGAMIEFVLLFFSWSNFVDFIVE